MCVSCLCVVCMCPLPLLIQLMTEGGVPTRCELTAFTLEDKQAHTSQGDQQYCSEPVSNSGKRGAHDTDSTNN